ncbi:Uncharacterised protein [Vibrio cholerae]|nr:Uncharacterised protein [Vibrio cholerae]CSD26021.1 Uncharacterised protein [Vibrio cholerae]CSI68202.1 Uncharacterised protein [Vibrio cholerae]CSI79644.1 Uncharacterised protein [Vibrio cholerae]
MQVGDTAVRVHHRQSGLRRIYRLNRRFNFCTLRFWQRLNFSVDIT